MTCDDQKDACPGDCSDCGEYKPISSKAAISRSIDFAVSILADLDNCISEDHEYDSIVVTVNAGRLAGICEALLQYAAQIDNVDIKELFSMNDLVQHHTNINNLLNTIVH